MVAQAHSRWSNLAFAAAFAVALFFFYEVVAPFVIPVLLAGFVVVICDPWHERIVHLFRGRRRVASLLSSLIVLVGVLLPLSLMAFLLIQQGLDLLARAQAALGPGALEELLVGRMPERLQPLADRVARLGIEEELRSLLQSAGAALTGTLASLFGATTRLVLDLFLTVIAMYYFFLDGPRLLEELVGLSPLENRYEREFFREFRSVAHTMVYVNFVTSLLQAAAGGLAFWLLGLPEPLVWAAVMGVFSIVPILGTGLVWAPAAIWLLATGRTAAGIFLLVWGVVVIGSVDNLVKPLLAKGRMRLHPLLVFLTIFGGIAAFGPVGALLGPLAGSIFTAMIRIWKRDFIPRLVEVQPPGPDLPQRA